jgi:ATP-dependent DNA ligase
VRDGKTVDLRSKRGILLNRYFPEVVIELGMLKPTRFVLDGELLVMVDGHADFDSLQLRMRPAESRVKKLSAEIPAIMMAFDLLVDAKVTDLRGTDFDARRAALEDFHGALGKQSIIKLSPVTRDPVTAMEWMKLARGGIDGVVAKRGSEHYQPGKRAMQKFKIWKTIDAVVAGIYEDDRGHVEHLLLGLYDDVGLLNYIGRCRSPGTETEIRKKLIPTMGGKGFSGHKPQPVNRWSGKKHVMVPLKPRLVLEASAAHVSGGRMRHGSRFVRWRPDKKPSQCRMEQVER